MKRIRIVFEGGPIRVLDVEDDIAEKLFSRSFKLHESFSFQDTSYRRYCVMMANVLLVEEILPDRSW